MKVSISPFPKVIFSVNKYESELSDIPSAFSENARHWKRLSARFPFLTLATQQIISTVRVSNTKKQTVSHIGRQSVDENSWKYGKRQLSQDGTPNVADRLREVKVKVGKPGDHKNCEKSD